jgi:hypothetical protein
MRGVFGRKGLGGSSGGGSDPPQRVAFETPDNPRLPVVRAKRADGPPLREAVLRTIRETVESRGRAALTNVETFVWNVFRLDAYATHQGGFDYYFAHIDDPGDWADATVGLEAMRQPEAARLVEEAVAVFEAGPHDPDADQAQARAYLDRMAELDRRWRALGLDIDRLLEDFVDQYYPWA